jgi:two-component system response regulator AtoC
MSDSIIVVEDEKIVRVSLVDALKAEGYTVLSVEDGNDAVAALEGGQFSLVITDIRLPGAGGLEILRKSLAESPATPVVMMTAYGNIKDAVEAMRLGAFDYITKPFDLDEMLLTVGRALNVRSLTEANIRMRKELSNYYGAPQIIGESKAMQAVFGLLEKISRTESTVLILGESGTGKELVASTIHFQSSRKDKPIVRVNCAALPDELIESELFGYEKGAFTGALARKPGRFEMADGGSIFLDEIGDLPTLTQTKLLRVLEEQTFERLGGTSSVTIDVRIITATNKDLPKEVRKGRFREDLYYRLNVIPIELPPLRDRKEDIPLLVDTFSRKFNDQMGSDVSFSPEAIETLMNYPFPGNVRELMIVVERCVALTDSGGVQPADLPAHIAKSRQEKTILASLQEITGEAERDHIRRILGLTRGNRSKAADILGVSRKTLWEKINLHQINI